MTEVRMLLDQEARRISAGPDALRETLRRGGRRRQRARRLTVVVALLVAAGGMAAAVAAFNGPYESANPVPADSGLGSSPEATLQPTPAVKTSTVTVGNATFTASASIEGDEPCVTVSSSGGELGGCGVGEGPLAAGEGGLPVNDQLYNVAYGLVPDGATAVEVVLGDGSTLYPDITNGVWLVVVPTGESGETSDFQTVTALDQAGQPLAEVDLPSLSAIRGNARHQTPTPG